MAVKAQNTMVKVPEPVEGPTLKAKKPPNNIPEKESSTVLGRAAFTHVLSLAIVFSHKTFKTHKTICLTWKVANRLLSDASFRMP